MASNSNEASSQRGGRNPNPGRKYNPPQPEASRVVNRPVPQGQVQDPRAFQLSQIRRRFSPQESTTNDGNTILKFKLAPSDPDFPFEMQALDCTLTVPKNFPNERESLRVTNAQMGRGYQINVEKGFDGIAARTPSATILQHVNALDRELETFLAAPKAETVKIMAHAIREKRMEPSSSARLPGGSATMGAAIAVQTAPVVQEPVYSPEQLEKARTKREADVRQLEGRMGRLQLFSKHRDGVTYTIPVDPPKRNDLPVCLRSLNTIDLVVPQLYNLEPCRIEVPGVIGDEVAILLENFQKWAQENPNVSLFAHINRLTQQMHIMAKSTAPKEAEPKNLTSTTELTKKPLVSVEKRTEDENDKSHIVVIPRPPEWNTDNAEHEDDEDDEEFSSYDSEANSDEELTDEPRAAQGQAEEPTGPEKGILMSLPNLELYSIELMELVTLGITVKCDRCKDITDVTGLRDSSKGDAFNVKSVSCKKCANKLSIGYRMDLMHANCVRAGYLDLDGCTVTDMLPSYFVPSCSECSTPVPAPGVVSVRGDSTMAICRECHKRMSFKIPEVKFLQVSTAAVRASQAPRKKKERLGIRAGEQLPNRGRCKHYSKSYRWFRFSCCNKVFPCDKCHDDASEHPNEHANRMICGYCSREQNYRPEDCLTCHASLTAKRGTGFWEGGKGTRDKLRMSRKDPRKYKRRPGTVSKT